MNISHPTDQGRLGNGYEWIMKILVKRIGWVVLSESRTHGTCYTKIKCAHIFRPRYRRWQIFQLRHLARSEPDAISLFKNSLTITTPP